METMNIYKKDIKVKYSEMDCNLVLKPSALLQFLQDLASENADNNDFGYEFVRKHNLAWYLLKYRMEFDDYPEKIFDLRITTEPRGYNKLFAFRDFALYNNDKFLAKISSLWAMVDLDNKTMANPAEILASCPYMTEYKKREDDLSFAKIRLPEGFNIEKEFEIRYEDLDVNGHVNNSNYIIWAFEPLDIEFRRNYKPKTIDIVFKKEIQYGNKVLSQLSLLNNETVHRITNIATGEELCLMFVKWN